MYCCSNKKKDTPTFFCSLEKGEKIESASMFAGNVDKVKRNHSEPTDEEEKRMLEKLEKIE